MATFADLQVRIGRPESLPGVCLLKATTCARVLTDAKCQLRQLVLPHGEPASAKGEEGWDDPEFMEWVSFFDLKDSTKQEQSLLKVKRELFDRDGALRPLTPNQWKEK